MSRNFTQWLTTTGPVQKDTTQSSSGVRWSTTQNSVVDIKPVNSTFDIPAFVIAAHNPQRFSRIAAQYNFTFPSSFTILNWRSLRTQLSTSINAGALAIRYRVGTTGYRYSLSENANFHLFPSIKQQYSGQIIKPNFVIEVWTGFVLGNFNLTNSLVATFITSILNIPASGSYNSFVNTPYAASIFDSRLAMPWDMPKLFSENVRWLDNN